jgi:hypothetical protein
MKGQPVRKTGAQKDQNRTRVVFQTEVSPATAEQFTAMCEETGVSQIAITSRLVQWFCRQDQHTQLRVLGMFGEDARTAATREYLERIAEHGQSAM